MVPCASFASLSLFALLAVLPSVSAHGFLHHVTIDGKTYKGNVPNNDAFPSPIRMIDDVGPVKGADNPSLSCGQNAALAEVVADANPGSTMSFFWVNGQGGNWPHDTGPMDVYMAECTGTTCDKFDASNAKWFKVDQVGREPGSDTWVQADTLFKGLPYTVTLPKDIAPGDYLVRQEIIALHTANTEGGAEFYPSCTQIRIGGNGDGKPSPSEQVSFPGAYKDTDPGIFDPDIFNPGSKYTFPGPAIAQLAASSGSSDGASNSSAGPSSAPSVSSTSVRGPSSTRAPSSGSSSKSGTCKKKRMLKRNVRHTKRRLSWF